MIIYIRKINEKLNFPKNNLQKQFKYKVIQCYTQFNNNKMSLIRECSIYFSHHDLGCQIPEMSNYFLEDILCFREGKTYNDQSRLIVKFSKIEKKYRQLLEFEPNLKVLNKNEIQTADSVVRYFQVESGALKLTTWFL